MEIYELPDKIKNDCFKEGQWTTREQQRQCNQKIVHEQKGGI
jgi:hypothetical protein